MENTKRIQDLLATVEMAIDLLPEPPKNTVKKEFKIVKELIMESRPPKIMIIGRRGAGKSSLVNAIFGEEVTKVGAVTSETAFGKWHLYKNTKGAINILDTRGLGDRTQPKGTSFENALDQIKAELKMELPDAILFLCKAKEVDSHIKEDIQSVWEIKDFIQYTYQYNVPVLAAITQVDELDPVDISTPPYEEDEKQANIGLAVNTLKEAFREARIPLLHIIPTSAYARFKADKRISQRYWNIDKLTEYLVEALPKTAQLELARITHIISVQKRIARIIIASSAAICGGIAATPIPVGDLIPITSAQVAMLIGIGYVAGRELDQKSATEFLTALGVNLSAGFALREVARALIKFILPGGGLLISSGIAFAATWGIGEAAIAYFIDEKSMEEAQQRYHQEKSQKQKENE